MQLRIKLVDFNIAVMFEIKLCDVLVKKILTFLRVGIKYIIDRAKKKKTTTVSQ